MIDGRQGLRSSRPSAERRRYDTSGRRAQSLANRERILRCARDLFVERGYAPVSVADIAQAAGVSVPTVFARFGSKVSLLKNAVDVAIAGDSEPVPLARRPAMLHVRAGATAEEIADRFAHLIATMAPQVVPIATVAYAAADSDREIAGLVTELDRQRYAGASALASVMLERSPALGVDPVELADQIWLVNAPSTWGLLVNGRGWSPQRFEDWARRTLRAALRPLA